MSIAKKVTQSELYESLNKANEAFNRKMIELSNNRNNLDNIRLNKGNN